MQSPRKQIISQHVIPDLSDIIEGYSSEALEWFADLQPPQSRSVENYPTPKCLDKYLMQFIMGHNNEEFLELYHNPLDIRFSSVNNWTAVETAVFYGNKYAFSDLPNHDTFKNEYFDY